MTLHDFDGERLAHGGPHVGREKDHFCYLVREVGRPHLMFSRFTLRQPAWQGRTQTDASVLRTTSNFSSYAYQIDLLFFFFFHFSRLATSMIYDPQLEVAGTFEQRVL